MRSSTLWSAKKKFKKTTLFLSMKTWKNLPQKYIFSMYKYFSKIAEIKSMYCKKTPWSAQTVENSNSFFTVSYIWYKSFTWCLHQHTCPYSRWWVGFEKPVQQWWWPRKRFEQPRPRGLRCTKTKEPGRLFGWGCFGTECRFHCLIVCWHRCLWCWKYSWSEMLNIHIII